MEPTASDVPGRQRPDSFFFAAQCVQCVQPLAAAPHRKVAVTKLSRLLAHLLPVHPRPHITTHRTAVGRRKHQAFALLARPVTTASSPISTGSVQPIASTPASSTWSTSGRPPQRPSLPLPHPFSQVVPVGPLADLLVPLRPAVLAHTPPTVGRRTPSLSRLGRSCSARARADPNRSLAPPAIPALSH